MDHKMVGGKVNNTLKSNAKIYTTRKTRDFTMIENATLRDTRLSLRAKALLALLVSLDNKGNSVIPISAGALSKYTKESRSAISRVFQELRDEGFCEWRQKRLKVKGKEGWFEEMNYFVWETRELRDEAMKRAEERLGLSSGSQIWETVRLPVSRIPSLREDKN